MCSSKPAAAPVAAKKPAADDSDEEDEDDVADIPIVVPAPKPGGGGKPRRASVSAESMDPSKLKAQMSQITSIEKSPDVTERFDFIDLS